MRPYRAATLLFLAGCVSDNGLTKHNAEPVATILSHNDGDEVYEGRAITLRGNVSDPDDAASQLTAAWYSGADTLCAEVPVDAEGASLCEVALGPDQGEVQIVGRDPEHAVGTAEVSLTVLPTYAPVVSFVSPSADARYYPDIPVEIEAEVSDAEDDVASLVLSWTDETGADPGLSTDLSGSGVVTGEMIFGSGEHSLTLRATDLDGKTGEATVSFTVGEGNLAPSCVWVDPLDGDVLTPNEDVTLHGQLTDPDVDAALLSAAWSSDLDGPLGNSPVASDGSTSITVGPLSVGPHLLTLRGTDDLGATCQSNVSISVGSPPTITITAPADGAVVSEGEPVLFTAMVSDEATLATDLTLTWSSDLEGLLGEDPADASGFVSLVVTDLARGTHQVTLSAEDGDGLVGSTTVELTIDGLPSAPTVSISPGSPEVGEALLAGIDVPAVDPEGDPVTYRYDWSVDGAPAGISTDTVPAGLTARGETWTVTAVASDGVGEGPAGSDVVVIANEVPELLSVTLTPDPAFEGDTLTCSPGPTSDADGDPVTLEFAWSVNGATVGETGDTLSSDTWSRGDTVVCTVTPYDGYTFGASVASNPLTISNSAPTADAASISPEPAHADDTLRCVASGLADPDGDAVTTLVTWTVDGAFAGTGDTLSGSFAGGDEVICSLVPTDGLDDGAAVTASLYIENSPPVVASTTLSPAAPVEGDTLFCSAGSTTDADGTTAFTYSYVWEVNGTTAAATGPALGSDNFARGDTVRCAISASDGLDSSTVTWSSAVVVFNSAPVLGPVSLSPSLVYTADTLLAAAVATDADGDTVSYAYSWVVNGSPVAATGNTLDGGWFDKGDTVYVSVTASDGSASSAAVVSSVVVVNNSVPSLSGATISPEAPAVGDTLVCAGEGFTDDDGDPDLSTYAWTINGSVAGSSDTLSGGFADGDLVICTVTPFDGEDAGVAQSVITVPGGGAPYVSSISVSPGAPTASSTLTCAVTAVDPEGDSVLLDYGWTVNGVDVGGNSATLTPDFFDRDDTVACAAPPNDGADFGSTATSASVTILNSAPTLSSVTLSPSPVYTDSTLTATPVASDLDGDTVSYTYSWTVNGSVVAATGATLAGSYFNRGDVVFVTVTPSDGTVSGAPVSSSTAFVLNSTPSITGATISPSAPSGSATLTCAATGYADADGDSAIYSYSWTVNGTLAGSGSTLSGVFSGGDLVACTVTPSDGVVAGSSATASVSVGNSAPTISAVSLTPTSATESSTLTCTPTSSDLDGDTVSYAWAWTVDGVVVPGASSSTLTGADFGRGDVVICVATPTDGASSGAAVSSNSVTIGNSAPVLSAVSISPSSPTLASTLTCSATGSDADGDSVSTTYAWSVNGSTLSGQTSATLASGNFGTGQPVICTATPSDGTTTGSPMSSGSVSVGNAAPTMGTVSLTPTSATESSTLSCSGSATDPDGDPISYTYAWTVNGATVSGATGTTLTGSAFSRGNTVACVMTPSDGVNAGTATSSNQVTISNTAPVATSVTLTPTSATESSTLTCSASGTDTDNDTVSFTYAWYVNSSVVTGQSNNTLTGAYFGAGNSVYCAATPTDGTSAGAAMNSSSVTISNTAPVISSVALSPTTAYESSTFTCTPSTTDVDGTTSFSYAYSWYVNGVLVAPTTATLTGTSFNKGNTVYCVATASDGAASSAAVSSNTVTVSNTAPVMTAATLSPATVYTSDTLTATGSASDADSDSVSYTYAWYVNGAQIVPTTATLSGASYFSRGDTVYVRITPTDGSASGTYMQSSTVTISNTAPTSPSVTITPEMADAGLDPLVCTVTTASSDVDGDTVSYSFTWTRNGAAYTGASHTSTTSTVPAAATATNDVFVCSATPTDGTSSGSAGTDTITVLAPPSYYGYPTPTTTPGLAGASYLLGPSFTLSSAGTLYALGANVGTMGNDMRIALYADSSGVPGTLVAYTDVATIDDTVMELDVVGGTVPLSAGTYWVMAVYNSSTYIYYASSSTATIRYKSASVNSTPSSSFGTSSSYTGYLPAYYLVVR